MNKNIEHFVPKRIPLPIKNGLGASRVRLPAESSPMTALEFLTEVISSQRHRHPEDHGSAIEKRFKDNEVVDSKGQPLAPESIITPNQDIFFYRQPAPEKHVPFEIITVYEDEKILVVDKPPFLATMPRAAHITQTATVRLRRATGNNELVPAHRLDRATSGLLLFTKSAEYRAAYQTLFAERKVSKRYDAIAKYQQIAPTTWRNRIDKKPGQYQAKIIDGEPNAITNLHSVEPLSDDEQRRLSTTYPGVASQLAHYDLEPVTGKTHQLRIHMYAAGAPILGDPAYPNPLPMDEEDFGRPLQLRSRSLAFKDPYTGEYRSFDVQATPPWEFGK